MSCGEGREGKDKEEEYCVGRRHSFGICSKLHLRRGGHEGTQWVHRAARRRPRAIWPASMLLLAARPCRNAAGTSRHPMAGRHAQPPHHSAHLVLLLLHLLLHLLRGRGTAAAGSGRGGGHGAASGHGGQLLNAGGNHLEASCVGRQGEASVCVCVCARGERRVTGRADAQNTPLRCAMPDVTPVLQVSAGATAPVLRRRCSNVSPLKPRSCAPPSWAPPGCAPRRCSCPPAQTAAWTRARRPARCRLQQHNGRRGSVSTAHESGGGRRLPPSPPRARAPHRNGRRLLQRLVEQRPGDEAPAACSARIPRRRAHSSPAAHRCRQSSSGHRRREPSCRPGPPAGTEPRTSW